MTNEPINPNPSLDEWISQTKQHKLTSYQEQRFDRLADSIAEYLDDDGCEPEVFLNDLREGLQAGRKYFYGRVAAYDHVLGAIQP